MRIHNNAELVRMPYLKKTDVGRISGYKRKDLNTLFDAAQEIDKKELGINYLFSYKVRTKTIAKLMGYSLKELMNMYPQIKNAQSVEEIIDNDVVILNDDQAEAALNFELSKLDAFQKKVNEGYEKKTN